MTPRHVVVIGGGIAGLAAAQRLRELGGPQLRITVVEQAPRLGGKIRTGELAGVPVETGAETFLVRRPEATALAETVGLGAQLVHPAAAPAALVIDDELRDLPRRTVMGVPARAADVAGVLSPAGRERLEQEPVGDGPILGDEDVTVGALVRKHFGDEIVDRLVDPLLGGVYSGRADGLSVDVTVPQLAAAARRHDTLAGAVADCLPPVAGAPSAKAVVFGAAASGAASSAPPVFGSVEGGLSRLVEATAAAAEAEIVLGKPVRELRRTPEGWRCVAGDTRTPRVIECDALVLATPARPAARLLADVEAAAAAELGVLDYASIALVTLALGGVDLPQRSGFLVPATEGRTIKAATFFTRKWPHLARPGLSLVRVSLGRYGEEQVLQRDDAELADIAHAELSAVLGMELPRPQAVAVDRWGGGLPQYSAGHADRIRRARRALAGHPIALAGALADGVGIPACVASGRAAAEAVHATLTA